ncbi:VanZ family protein [Actinoplanes sp. NPDC051859]|uniref:VanZ family protein n=1 Tax=Actinoplanes sp. NPDC051859 TaxID=3363909 RepID=UPI0037B30BE5
MTPESLATFVTNPVPQVVFVACLICAWPLSRFARHRITGYLMLASVAMIVALTATPNYVPPVAPTLVPPHFLTQWNEPRLVWSLLTAAPSDAEQIANIALYVPLGLAGHVLWRSVLRTTAYGFLLVLTIETAQYLIPGRAGSITDIRNNTLGTFLGALAAAAVLLAAALAGRLWRRGHTKRRLPDLPVPQPPPSDKAQSTEPQSTTRWTSSFRR